MSQHNQEQIQEQIAVLTSNEFHTQYAGVIALQRLWQSWQISAHLNESKIRYGQGREKAAAFTFALMLGFLVEVNSVRQVAQRFGGESSVEAAERDRLLAQMVPEIGDQRTLSRFVNQARHAWNPFRLATEVGYPGPPRRCTDCG